MNHRPHPLVARPNWLRGLLGAGSLLALSLCSEQALAQADISAPPPNILLLVDTSGSMDYKTGSSDFPACHYSGSTVNTVPAEKASERSRWIEAVEVLTGSIQDYDCQRLDRSSSGFKTEYSLTGPYDALYTNPYHRPASNGCVIGPGTLDPSNKAAFPAGALKFHPFNNTAGSCSFGQASDGILDAFVDDVRFGLMTFDSEPKSAKDVGGLWSYYVTGAGPSRPAQGMPAGCATTDDQEVGARNADAPPWEGRAVGFGNPVGTTDFKSRNAMIQQVLLSTRPYGATPIAGMLDDARAYFLSDTSDDPINTTFKFGPSDDPAKECRKKSIILLSDGQPNLDLRPSCEGGVCPYSKAEDIAQDLKNKGIDVYVIGFALPSLTVGSTTKTCASFTADDFDESIPTGICRQYPNDINIQACCALNRIAAAGGHTPTSADDPDWRRAHFADNRDMLRSELSQAIGGSFKSTTRTPFVSASGSGFASQSSDLVFARAFRFAASFKPGKLDKPWIGELNRSRYQCISDSSGIKPTLLAPDATKGDKFVDNVNSGGPAKRKLYTVVGDSPIDSSASMRPNLASGVVDGVGTYSGTTNTTAKSSADFVSDMPPKGIGVDDTSCTALNATQCRDRYLNWLVGLNNGTVYQRCPSSATGNCNLVSEFYHSIPRAVAGRPSQFLVDQSYQRYVTTQVTAKRPSVLYASSNDGFLHAFKIAQVDKDDSSETMQVKTQETNELWAFVPPGVLTGIPSLYPASRQALLDGTPAIKDVVASDNPSGTNYKFLLERTLDQARGGLGAWRTILVQSYGSKRPGYFALDVTDPVPSSTSGPKFLWQLQTDSTGKPLFGAGGGTPLITTVYFKGKEVAVAVLPGGYPKEPATAASCLRATASFTDLTVNGAPAPRQRVPCYPADSAPARSLTVVRLDSGEILRTFRRDESEVPGLVGKGVWTKAPLDSPMTGQPVGYPADVGAVADRVFIGDQDGTLWRLNFASKSGDPADWLVEMFLDAFPKDPPFNHLPADGQPIISAPVISVDRIGNLTVAVSTGDQEANVLSGAINYVWSLTELPSADRMKLSPKVNWYLKLDGNLAGDRVIGEMAMFAGDLFFSTVGPDKTSDACSSGSGKVWGMHYLDANPAGAGEGGKLSTTFTSLVGSNAYIDATTLLGTDPRGFLSGVSVSQQPTCDSVSSTADDGYFAYGVKPSGSPPAAGKYQLIIPTGDRVSTTTAAGITPISSGGSNGVAITLTQPPLSLVVDSWASVVE